MPKYLIIHEFMKAVAVIILFAGICLPVSASAEDDHQLAYKDWQHRVLAPSFGAYLQSFDTLREELLQKPIEQSLQSVQPELGLTSMVKAILDGRRGQRSSTTLSLNLKEAMQLALSLNRDLQSSLLTPGLAGIDQEIARTVYDPTLFSENNYYDSTRPIQTVLDNGTDGSTGKTTFEERGWSTQTGVRQPLPTGGFASFSYEADNLYNNSDLTIPNPQYTSRFRIELRQSLMKEFGDRSNKSNIELADLAYSQAESEYQKSLANVLEELARYYWRYKYYHQLETISQAAVGAAEIIVSKIKTKNEQGIANLLDLDRAESSLQDRRIRLITDKKLTHTTLNQLKMVLGIPPSSMEFLSVFVPTEPFIEAASLPEWDNVLKMALARRKEIAISRQSVAAAEIKMQLAEHLRLPTVDARSSYTTNGLGGEYGDGLDDSVSGGQGSWELGLIVEWPIGGRKSSLELQKSQLIKRRAQIQFKKVMEKVVYEVESIYREALLSATEVEASWQAMESYRKILEREQALFDISRVGNQRILDGQDEYYDAERIYLRGLLNLNISLLRLQWAQGILLETFEFES